MFALTTVFTPTQTFLPFAVEIRYHIISRQRLTKINWLADGDRDGPDSSSKISSSWLVGENESENTDFDNHQNHEYFIGVLIFTVNFLIEVLEALQKSGRFSRPPMPLSREAGKDSQIATLPSNGELQPLSVNSRLSEINPGIWMVRE